MSPEAREGYKRERISREQADKAELDYQRKQAEYCDCFNYINQTAGKNTSVAAAKNLSPYCEEHVLFRHIMDADSMRAPLETTSGRRLLDTSNSYPKQSVTVIPEDEVVEEEVALPQDEVLEELEEQRLPPDVHTISSGPEGRFDPLENLEPPEINFVEDGVTVGGKKLCISLPIPDITSIEFDIFKKKVISMGMMDIEVCAPPELGQLIDKAKDSVFLWDKTAIIAYAKMLLDVWFLEDSNVKLDWDSGDWELEDGQFVCRANTERCKCDDVDSVGISFSISLGGGFTAVVGGGAAAEIGFQTGCMMGLPLTHADSAERAQGFTNQRWVIMPYHGASISISVGADPGWSGGPASNFGFARPFEYMEDFGHDLTIGTDVGPFSGDIVRPCCRQPFSKEGAPFRFLYDSWEIPAPFNFAIYYPVFPFFSAELAGAGISGPVYAMDAEGMADMEAMAQQQASFAEIPTPTEEHMSLIAEKEAAAAKEGGLTINMGYARGCRRFDPKGLLECFNKFNPDGTHYFDLD